MQTSSHKPTVVNLLCRLHVLDAQNMCRNVCPRNKINEWLQMALWMRGTTRRIQLKTPSCARDYPPRGMRGTTRRIQLKHLPFRKTAGVSCRKHQQNEEPWKVLRDLTATNERMVPLMACQHEVAVWRLSEKKLFSL